MNETGYSRETFGYGRTYYYSFIQLIESTPELLDSMLKKRPMVVLGSSLGWHGFYTSLTYNGVHVTGYELLASRVQVANQLAEGFKLTDQVQFVHADALSTPQDKLQEAGIILFTDLLWGTRCLKESSLVWYKTLEGVHW